MNPPKLWSMGWHIFWVMKFPSSRISMIWIRLVCIRWVSGRNFLSNSQEIFSRWFLECAERRIVCDFEWWSLRNSDTLNNSESLVLGHFVEGSAPVPTEQRWNTWVEFPRGLCQCCHPYSAVLLVPKTFYFEHLKSHFWKTVGFVRECV